MNEGTSTDGEDVLTQVLGKEYPGRLRALWGGATKRRISSESHIDPTKYAKMEAKLNKMEAILASKFGINLDADGDDEIGEDTLDLTKVSM